MMGDTNEMAKALRKLSPLFRDSTRGWAAARIDFRDVKE